MTPEEAADRRDARKGEIGAIKDRPAEKVAAETKADRRAVIRKEARTRPGRTEPAAIKNRENSAEEIKDPATKDRANKGQGNSGAAVAKVAEEMKADHPDPGRSNRAIKTAADRDPGRKNRAQDHRAMPTPPIPDHRDLLRNSPNLTPSLLF